MNKVNIPKIFNPKQGGVLSQLKHKRTYGEPRVDCHDCEHRILLSINPTGYCRKCFKKNKRKTLRMDNRRKRGTL